MGRDRHEGEGAEGLTVTSAREEAEDMIGLALVENGCRVLFTRTTDLV